MCVSFLQFRCFSTIKWKLWIQCILLSILIEQEDVREDMVEQFKENWILIIYTLHFKWIIWWSQNILKFWQSVNFLISQNLHTCFIFDLCRCFTFLLFQMIYLNKIYIRYRTEEIKVFFYWSYQRAIDWSFSIQKI